MDLEKLRQYLVHFGHLPDTDAELEEGLRSLQKFAGLPETGQLDQETLEVIVQPRCGNPDTQNLAEFAKWRKNRLKYFVRDYLPGLTQTEQDKVFRRGYDLVEAVCDLKFTQVFTEREADLIISWGRGRGAGFDGPGRTLAYAYLAQGDDRPLLMMFDGDERWINDPNQDIYMLAVFTHELLHNLGLDHTNKSDQLMAPFYKRTVWKPQSEDIARLVANYGRPISGPTDPVDPPPPGPTDCSILKDIIRVAVKQITLELEKRAKTTINPLDDIAAKFAKERQEWLVDLLYTLLNNFLKGK